MTGVISGLKNSVMAGFMPATHTHNGITERMGRRDKPGDDDVGRKERAYRAEPNGDGSVEG